MSTAPLAHDVNYECFQESEPLQIHKADVAVEVWSGLNRRGVWKGHRIVVKKFSKKEVTAARIEEMLRDTVLLAGLEHDNLVKVSPIATKSFSF